MPIYEYSCKNCDNRFEKLLKSMSDSEVVPCPKCGSKKTEKELSVFAVGAEQARTPARPACQSCASAGGCPMAGMD